MRAGKNNTRNPEDPEGVADVPVGRGLECFTLNCVCDAFSGRSNGSKNDCTLPNGKKLKKCNRKEIRMLTPNELQIYKDTLLLMKVNKDYDLSATVHAFAWNDGGAHNGPSFFPWHRSYLNVHELMGRQSLYTDRESADFCLPYWDSTLDIRLPSPKDSCLFTAEFFGRTNASGLVIDGAFSPWETTQNEPYIRRRVGRDGSCYQERFIDWQMKQKNITKILAYTMPDDTCQVKVDSNYPEYPHGAVHTFIGGLMSDPATSANDPIFHAHHCFVDLLWELWRQKQQTYAQRPVDYPVDILDCERPIHFKNEKMSQFKELKNIDGCRNEYTDNMYEYAPRPTCTVKNPNCGSEWLFCDLSHGNPHCAAKACPGGSCRGFTKGEQVCYNGNCVNNVCVAKPMDESTTEIPTTTKETLTTETPSTTTETPTTEYPTTKTPTTSTEIPTTTTKILTTETPTTENPKTTTVTPSTTTETPTTKTPRLRIQIQTQTTTITTPLTTTTTECTEYLDSECDDCDD